MPWYWWAALMGIALPWSFMGKSLRASFSEGGLLTGLGAWSGACVITLPFAFALMWVIQWLTRA